MVAFYFTLSWGLVIIYYIPRVLSLQNIFRLSFVAAFIHVVAGRKKKETLSHIPRQPAYLQLFDCLTQRQKMAAAAAAKEVAIWKTLHAHHYLPENNNNAAIAASTVFQPHLSG